MTLPFRRRHHDDEASHDRARSLASAGMLDALDSADESWLVRHLDGCAECRQEREAFIADRALLRGLRDHTPEPPRDLWARTSAAIEHEARTHRGRPAAAPARGRGLPFGAIAGALIVMVVIGASLIPPIAPPSATPGDSSVAVVSSAPEPTDMEITAGRVAWIRPAANGSWEYVRADVGAVCPRSRPSCRPLAEDGPGRPVNLAGTPVGVTISPTEDQLVVEARGTGSAPDRIYVVPVPSKSPTVTPAPTDAVTTESPSAVPVTPEPGSPEPSISPDGILEIATGVIVVGEAAYSQNGRWLAFSARPSDGSAGPDLYVWTVGQPAAVVVTSDHRTYFSTWLGNEVLASRVTLAGLPEASDAPTATPDADPSVAPMQREAHPSSFLLDPSTLAQTDLATPDLWMPVVDPTGRFVAYWSGTVSATADGQDWQPATGQLVLDGWSAGPDAQPSQDPDETADPAATPVPGLGPVGTPVAVIPGPTAAFKAKFDPTGTRLAVWVAEELDADIGRLHVLVLDPATGAIATGPEPLPGVPALRRFSIALGRVAWVTPSGQDGQESTVQVLGWTSTDFGEIKTIPAKALNIVR